MTTQVDGFSNSVRRRLRDYEIDADRGFLPGLDPLDRLPNYFSPWEEIGRELPKLLMTGSVRSFIEAPPSAWNTGVARRSSLGLGRRWDQSPCH